MPHTSFSRLSKWEFCPNHDKIRYIDGIRLFWGNEYTAFGDAVHGVVEKLVKKQITPIQTDVEFDELFKSNLRELPFDVKFNLFRNPKGIEDKQKKEKTQARQRGVKDMFLRGAILARLAFDQLAIQFPGYKLVQAEEELVEPITDFTEADWDFKGYIDLVIQTPDGKYHIIDWKTCSWGWDIKKKSDRIITNQLAYYKHFLCLNLDIDVNKTETYFGLIKRTAFVKNKRTGVVSPKKDAIEIFRVSTGPRKRKNALNILVRHVYNVHHKNFIKNKLSCKNCEYFNTDHCPDRKRRKRDQKN